MKKEFLYIIVLFCLVLIISVPILVKAAFVECDTNCGISDLFTTLVNIYNFLTKDIAAPLAIIAITVGGIMMLISAGNPNLMGTGKKILWTAIIGLVLVFCSFLIINFIACTTLKYCSWSTI